MPSARRQEAPYNDVLLKILSSLNVCSKEWVIRQYDHEVQGGSVVKPLVGRHNDGPSDAAVIAPVLGSTRGLAIGCGINPRYGDLDPYWMAASAIDEAVRNVVAVGADPRRIAILDNFCWGNTDRPDTLGSLVRAAEACRDVAKAYGTPFISGKDSLNNEFHAGDVHLVIPPTLLISALGLVPDVRKCVTMDLKKPHNVLCLLGATKNEMGGSCFNRATGCATGTVPRVVSHIAPRLFARLHEAIQRGLVVACHDVSEGGLAAALAEMCLAGGVGATINAGQRPDGIVRQLLPPDVLLFAETNTRFVVEVPPEQVEVIKQLFSDLPCECIGVTVALPRLVILGEAEVPWIDVPIPDLKEAWQRPLRW